MTPKAALLIFGATAVLIAGCGGTKDIVAEQLAAARAQQRADWIAQTTAQVQDGLRVALRKGAPPAAGKEPVKSVGCVYARDTIWRCEVVEDLLALPDPKAHYTVTVTGKCWRAHLRPSHGVGPEDAFDTLLKGRVAGCFGS